MGAASTCHSPCRPQRTNTSAGFSSKPTAARTRFVRTNRRFAACSDFSPPTALPRETLMEKRDRALVQFLVSTGCRISEALGLDRTDFPRSGNRLVVTGKGSKQRSVYLTGDARQAMEDFLTAREDACLALFINFDRSAGDDRERRLTSAGARYIVKQVGRRVGAWSFKSPHVARHTAGTTLLEVT